MAHSHLIEEHMDSVLKHPPSRVLIDLLRGGEMKTDRLESEAKVGGVARSTMFKTLGELERSGVIERPRRGLVALSQVAADFASFVDGKPSASSKKSAHKPVGDAQ